MNRVRSALLLAAATLIAVPTVASAQDAGPRQGREFRSDGGGARSFQGGGDRGQFRAPPAGRPLQGQPPRAGLPPQGNGQHFPQNRAGGFAGQGRPDRPIVTPDRGNHDRRGFADQRNGWDRRNDWDRRDPRRDDNRGWQDNNRGWRGNDHGWRGNDVRRRDDRRGFVDRSSWNGNRGGFRTDWRNDRRYDWRSYRAANRNLFRGRYIPPRGYNYGYRSFSIGYRLDPFFYASSYWIADPWQYRLPPADGPYRWVRYYDDVLLVDTITGEVVDVIQGFFW